MLRKGGRFAAAHSAIVPVIILILPKDTGRKTAARVKNKHSTFLNPQVTASSLHI